MVSFASNHRSLLCLLLNLLLWQTASSVIDKADPTKDNNMPASTTNANIPIPMPQTNLRGKKLTGSAKMMFRKVEQVKAGSDGTESAKTARVRGSVSSVVNSDNAAAKPERRSSSAMPKMVRRSRSAAASSRSRSTKMTMIDASTMTLKKNKPNTFTATQQQQQQQKTKRRRHLAEISDLIKKKYKTENSQDVGFGFFGNKKKEDDSGDVYYHDADCGSDSRKGFFGGGSRSGKSKGKSHTHALSGRSGVVGTSKGKSHTHALSGRSGAGGKGKGRHGRSGRSSLSASARRKCGTTGGPKTRVGTYVVETDEQLDVHFKSRDGSLDEKFPQWPHHEHTARTKPAGKDSSHNHAV